MSDGSKQSSIEAVDILALQALGFVASDPERLKDFVAATGITPQDLLRRADDHDVMAGVLERLLQDEASLLMFCANAGIAPNEIAHAHATLEAQRTRTAQR